MPDSGSAFQNALGNMTREVAYSSSIRHLTDAGFSVRQICEKLTYPAPYETVRRIAYERLLETGIILTEEPKEGLKQDRVTYVLDENGYGRKSYRRVITPAEEPEDTEYIPCDLGSLDESTMQKIKDTLYVKEWDYIEGIPWPKSRVYHKATPYMKEIAKHLEQAGLSLTRPTTE